MPLQSFDSFPLVSQSWNNYSILYQRPSETAIQSSLIRRIDLTLTLHQTIPKLNMIQNFEVKCDKMVKFQGFGGDLELGFLSHLNYLWANHIMHTKLTGSRKFSKLKLCDVSALSCQMEHGLGSRTRTATARTVTVSPRDNHPGGINNVQGKSDFGHHCVNCGAHFAFSSWSPRG